MIEIDVKPQDLSFSFKIKLVLVLVLKLKLGYFSKYRAISVQDMFNLRTFMTSERQIKNYL